MTGKPSSSDQLECWCRSKRKNYFHRNACCETKWALIKDLSSSTDSQKPRFFRSKLKQWALSIGTHRVLHTKWLCVRFGENLSCNLCSTYAAIYCKLLCSRAQHVECNVIGTDTVPQNIFMCINFVFDGTRLPPVANSRQLFEVLGSLSESCHYKWIKL